MEGSDHCDFRFRGIGHWPHRRDAAQNVLASIPLHPLAIYT